MRTYVREDYTLEGVEHPGPGEGRAYRVLTPEGRFVGTVGTYQAKMERRTPGKRYVNARWYSERWWAQKPGSRKRHRFAFLTPGEGARWLLRQAKSDNILPRSEQSNSGDPETSREEATNEGRPA